MMFNKLALLSLFTLSSGYKIDGDSIILEPEDNIPELHRLYISNNVDFKIHNLGPEDESKAPNDLTKLFVHHWHLHAHFNEWKNKFNKVYDSVDEEYERLMVWIHNHEFIEKHNAKNLSYKLGHNHFSDLTNDEFKKLNYLGEYSRNKGQIADKKKKLAEKFNLRGDTTQQARILKECDCSEDDPALDWREKGAVTEVKDQGMCGSCWSFSTTGSIEGASFLLTGTLTPISEQNLIDCDYTDLGCNGGLMDDAFQYDENAGGLCSEADYPYKAVQSDVCMTNCTKVPGSHVSTFTDVEPNDLGKMMDALTQQPVSVAIEADTLEFQMYSSGVFESESCGVNLDHAVLAVGYGSEGECCDKKDYFIVKNSWGASWGDEGYIKISRNSAAPEGMCGILAMASYPTVEL